MSLNSSQSSLIWTSDGSPREKKEASKKLSAKKASEPKKAEKRNPQKNSMSTKNVQDP